MENILRQQKLNSLFSSMIEFYAGDAEQIQHFTKVHSFAKLIGHMEHLNKYQQFILEAASYVHDIGIKAARELYGNSMGKYQEELGPDKAEELLKKCNFSTRDIEKIKFLVGHHHTYTDIKSLDHQILIEADFLVNFYENKKSLSFIKETYDTIFKTETGKQICNTMFGMEGKN
jgi:hypothetical protein